MTEYRGSDMAINFISTQAKSRVESQTIEDVGMTFDAIESMSNRLTIDYAQNEAKKQKIIDRRNRNKSREKSYT